MLQSICTNRTVILVLGVTLLIPGLVNAETGYQDSGIFSINTSVLSPVQEISVVPLLNALSPCHPNPFNPRTTIKYRLAKAARAHLAVFDLKGRLVRTLQMGELLSAGSYEAVWNGRDNAGQSVAGGVYLYRLEAGDYSSSQRMTLIK
jgi:hypothetical protein